MLTAFGGGFPLGLYEVGFLLPKPYRKSCSRPVCKQTQSVFNLLLPFFALVN
jgi:hypothetical protein